MAEEKLIFRPAEMGDWEDLCAFYKNVADNTIDMKKHCRWIYGLHPSDEMIKGYIAKNCLHLGELDGEIVAAAALTLSQTEEYHDVEWGQKIADDEAAVLHMLGVHPGYQHRGIAGKLVEYLIETAKKAGKKSLRLDALKTNTPAQKLYEGLGFVCRGQKVMYAPNVSYTDFMLYERDI